MSVISKLKSGAKSLAAKLNLDTRSILNKDKASTFVKNVSGSVSSGIKVATGQSSLKGEISKLVSGSKGGGFVNRLVNSGGGSAVLDKFIGPMPRPDLPVPPSVVTSPEADVIAAPLTPLQELVFGTPPKEKKSVKTPDYVGGGLNNMNASENDPGPSEDKKGMPVWGWVLIGVGLLGTVIALIFGFKRKR